MPKHIADGDLCFQWPQLPAPFYLPPSFVDALPTKRNIKARSQLGGVGVGASLCLVFKFLSGDTLVLLGTGMLQVRVLPGILMLWASTLLRTVMLQAKVLLGMVMPQVRVLLGMVMLQARVPLGTAMGEGPAGDPSIPIHAARMQVLIAALL